MLDILKKWLPTVLTAVTPLLLTASDGCKAAVTGNPIASAIVATVVGILLHWMPSPAAKS